MFTKNAKTRNREHRRAMNNASLFIINYSLFIICGLLFVACETSFDNQNSGIPLAGPKSIQVMGKDGALFVQWTKVASAQGVVPYYEVYYSTTATPTAKLDPDTYSGDMNLVTAEIPGLQNYTPYYVWVKAVFPGLGVSDYSPIETGTPIPPPVPPSALQATSSEGGIELAWTAGQDAFLYEIYYAAGSGGAPEPPEGAAMKSVASTGAFVSGLDNGIPHRLWVRSTNTAGVSAYAAITETPMEQATPPASAPTITSVTSGNKKLTLTWQQVSGVPRYKIFYSNTPDDPTPHEFGTPIPADSPTVTAELTGLPNAALYYVRVASVNSKGMSGYSAPETGTPQAKPAINWDNMQFEVGQALSDFPFAEDLPPSVFFGAAGRPNTDRLTRVHETALGDLWTDAAAWYAREVLDEPCDFVFLNGSYIDNALPRGRIRLSTIVGMTKPDARTDRIVFLTLSGANLKKFLGLGVPVDMLNPDYMSSVASVPHTGHGSANTGFFGNVSSELRYTLQYPKAPSGYAPMLTREDSEVYYHGRIKAGTLKLNGADIIDTQNYRICTTDYNYSGIFFTLLRTHSTNVKPTGIPYWHAVAEYIYDKETVSPRTDSRIKIEGGIPLPPPWTAGDWEL
jgi:hypothetical protein